MHKPTHKQGRQKVTIGPAGCVLHMRLAGKNTKFPSHKTISPYGSRCTGNMKSIHVRVWNYNTTDITNMLYIIFCPSRASRAIHMTFVPTFILVLRILIVLPSNRIRSSYRIGGNFRGYWFSLFSWINFILWKL